jgi:predicted AlkP superfamily phosphohydrolase/phosphomutase
MTALTETDKMRVRFHLCYNQAVPDGDRQLLESRMESLDSPVWASGVRDRLNRCDRTLLKTELDAQSSSVQSRRTIVGDVNRTDVNNTTAARKERQKAYLDETDNLALELGCPNYRNPSWWGNMNMRIVVGTERIPAPWAAGNLYLNFG